MFKKPSAESEQLERTIMQLEADMENVSGDSEDYPKMANQLERLYKLKATNAKKQVDPNTLILVGGNLLGILVIVFHERANAITSKAIGFVVKPR